MNGVLVVDKPVGPTSHDVVSRARRALGTRRIGHTGTLDPLASGVLPLVVGQATRLARFLSGDDKSYRAGIRFGASTTTYDATGERTGGQDVTPERTAIAAALEQFRGAYLQMPPPYSAKKVAGTPAYALARRGEAPVLKAVPVVVRTLTLVETEGTRADVEVSCSAGFYVRTLAHDLGQALGCGAHLESLRRTRAGAFALEHAMPLADLEHQGTAAGAALIPLPKLLPDLTWVVLTEEGARRASHGSLLSAGDVAAGGETLEGLAAGSPVRLLAPAGGLLGIAEADHRALLHPVVILV